MHHLPPKLLRLLQARRIVRAMSWYLLVFAALPGALLLNLGLRWNPAAREKLERWFREVDFWRRTVLGLAVGAAYVVLSIVIGPVFGVAFALALDVWAAWFAWSSWRQRPSAN